MHKHPIAMNHVNNKNNVLLTSAELEAIVGGDPGPMADGAAVGAAAGSVFGFCAWASLSFLAVVVTGGAALPLVGMIAGGAALGGAAGAAIVAL